ncbi:hypothetical protein LJC68_01175 [Bacteroidales bacterium OttesenSCG-928-B11]|nr:hypothetical protein [Bacteroidales bacterium OttesenSCG-928-B11]MDL2325596.1 hypothetical protein [Bacteroidales bacterium OttesenSCG-928-A14]
MRGCYDATMLVVNRQQKILDTISLHGAPLKFRSNEETLDDADRYWVSSRHMPLIWEENTTFLPLVKWGGFIGNDSLLGVVSKGKPFRRLPIGLPDPGEGFEWDLYLDYTI